MAASRYRAFLKLCETWPVLKNRDQRDVGTLMKKRVMEAFSKGEASTIDDKDCDEFYQSLQRMSNNTYKTKWQRSIHTNASGSSLEALDEVLSTDSLSELAQENSKGLKAKFRDLFKSSEK